MTINTALRTAVFNALDGSIAGVQRVVQGRVQDADSGAGTAFPMIRIGAVVITRRDTQTTNGEATIIRLHTYSRSGSYAQCAAIQDAIYALLHRQPLTIAGYANISLLREDTTILDGDEGQAHGVCEYRALVHQS